MATDGLNASLTRLNQAVTARIANDERFKQNIYDTINRILTRLNVCADAVASAPSASARAAAGVDLSRQVERLNAEIRRLQERQLNQADVTYLTNPLDVEARANNLKWNTNPIKRAFRPPPYTPGSGSSIAPPPYPGPPGSGPGSGGISSGPSSGASSGSSSWLPSFLSSSSSTPASVPSSSASPSSSPAVAFPGYSGSPFVTGSSLNDLTNTGPNGDPRPYVGGWSPRRKTPRRSPKKKTYRR
jgi:hypothetical protein